MGRGRSRGTLRLAVEIFVPRGEELARHTLNPRLGIVGGISILGTTGLVKPFSHQAYRATIAASLRVARAAGLQHIAFSTGGKSEGYLKELLPDLPDAALVQMGDYVRFALKVAAGMGFREITAAAFFGKALKIAQGFGHTHASQGLADLKELGRWTLDLTGDALLAQAVARANTARQALEILTEARAGQVVAQVGERMLAALRDYGGPTPQLIVVVLDFDGTTLWQGQSSRGGGMIPVQVVGLGMSPADLTPSAQEIIREAQVLVGRRLLDYFPEHRAMKIPLGKDPEGTLTQLPPLAEAKRVVVLASGDPNFYGIGPLVVKVLGAEQVVIHPNLTAVQAACARLKMPWQEATIISLHGRSWESLAAALGQPGPLIIYTDPVHTPGAIARFLLARG